MLVNFCWYDSIDCYFIFLFTNGCTVSGYFALRDNGGMTIQSFKPIALC